MQSLQLCILIPCHSGSFVTLGVLEVAFGRWVAASHIEFGSLSDRKFFCISTPKSGGMVGTLV